MKKKTFLFAVTVFSLLFACGIFAQNKHFLLEGEQYRGHGENARLVSEGLQLNSKGTIYKVEGINEGFWITNANGVIIKSFSDMDNAVGYKLKRGTYYIYPNLKNNEGYAVIRAYIK